MVNELHSGGKEHSNADEAPLSEPRRKVLLYFWFGAQAVLAALIVIPGLRYFLQPLYEKVQSQRIQLGDLRALPEDEPTRVNYSILKRAGYEVSKQNDFVYALRKQNQVKVFSPVCTHMGCNVAWNQQVQEFQCPCHGGKYSKDGKVIAGPPPKPLHQYPVDVDNGTVWITLGETKT